MDEREAERVVRDGMRYGMEHPRTVKESARMNGRILRGQPLVIGKSIEGIPSVTFSGLWQADWTERIKQAEPEMVIVAMSGTAGVTLTNHLNANGVLAYLGKE
jgi:uncharacterized protein